MKACKKPMKESKMKEGKMEIMMEVKKMPKAMRKAEMKEYNVMSKPKKLKK